MPRQVLSFGDDDPAFSEAVRAGDFLFLSGLAGRGPDGEIVEGGIASETDRIMADAADLLKRGGAMLDDIVRVTVYLTRPDDLRDFDAAYARYFPTRPPARTCVIAVSSADARLQMDFVAYTGAA